MKFDEVKDNIIKALKETKLFQINLNDVKFTLLSDRSFDLTYNGSPIGVTVDLSDEDKSYTINFDTRRFNREKSTFNSKDAVDEAIEEYFDGKV